MDRGLHRALGMTLDRRVLVPWLLVALACGAEEGEPPEVEPDELAIESTDQPETAASAETQSCTPWRPTGRLARVPVIPDCSRTGGDIAVASAAGPVIFYCPRTAAELERVAPGAGHFFYVHEYGHVALRSSDERRVDCWAAQQLRGTCWIPRIVEYLRRGPPWCHPRYGCRDERAARIARCGRG